MKMPSTANQIELVLPLKERINYLDRCLHHYRAYRVVVVDSSIKSNAALLSKFSNVDYFHTPNLDFFQQCSFGLEKINSPYTSILCDDDFLLHSFIKHAITELQNNIEFSGAIGDSIRFFEGTFDLDVNRTIIHFRNLNYIRTVTRRNFVNGYGFFVRHYFAGFHAVFRTAVLKQVIDDFECYPELKELNAADRAFLLFVFKRAPLLIANRIAHLRSSDISVHVQIGMLKGRPLAQLLKMDAAPLNDIGLDIFHAGVFQQVDRKFSKDQFKLHLIRSSSCLPLQLRHQFKPSRCAMHTVRLFYKHTQLHKVSNSKQHIYKAGFIS